MFGYIYIITNKITNKKYVGKKKITKNHNNYFGSSKWLNNDIKKFGKNNFEKTIIEYCKNNTELTKKEIHYQKLWNVKESTDWYNMHIQNEGFDTTGLRFKYSDEQKKKIWPEERRKKMSEKMKKNNLNYLPGVIEARKKRLKDGYCPFKDSKVQQKVWLSRHFRPFKIKTPDGKIVVVDNQTDFKRKFNFTFNPILLTKGKIQQGKNKGYEYLGQIETIPPE